MGDKRVRDATFYTGTGLMRGASESPGSEVSFPPRDAGQGRAGLCSRGVLREGEEKGVHLRLWRKSEGEAPELIGRLDASSMPVMFWRQVTWEEEGREGQSIMWVKT